MPDEPTVTEELRVLPPGTLPWDEIAHEFEGADHGVEGVSFLVVEAPPGGGPRLHRHDYPEVFILLEGTARFRAGELEQDFHPGTTLVVPAGVPHGFTNVGETTLKQVDIHASSRFATEWLEP